MHVLLEQHSTVPHRMMTQGLTHGKGTLWKAIRRGKPVKDLLLGSSRIPHSCQSLQARSSRAFGPAHASGQHLIHISRGQPVIASLGLLAAK